MPTTQQAELELVSVVTTPLPWSKNGRPQPPVPRLQT